MKLQGQSVAVIAREAAKKMGLELDGATVAIQGFGNVGGYTATYTAKALK